MTGVIQKVLLLLLSLLMYSVVIKMFCLIYSCRSLAHQRWRSCGRPADRQFIWVNKVILRGYTVTRQSAVPGREVSFLMIYWSNWGLVIWSHVSVIQMWLSYITCRLITRIQESRRGCYMDDVVDRVIIEWETHTLFCGIFCNVQPVQLLICRDQW